MKVNKKATQEKWFEMDSNKDVKFLIRPFPMFMRRYDNTSDNLSQYKNGKEKFMYCVVDWKGIIDEEDKPLKCNKENKEYIFDFVAPLAIFIVTKISEFDDIILSEKKI